MKFAALLFASLLAAAAAPMQEKQDTPKPDAPKPEYDIVNFFRISPEICTAGQPKMADLERMKVAGLKALLNLRTPEEYKHEEEEAKAKELGLRYFNLPVNSKALNDDLVAEFLNILADPANRPLFIHCATNNRVASFWMIRRVLVDKWKLEDARAEAEKMGLRPGPMADFASDYIARHQKK